MASPIGAHVVVSAVTGPHIENRSDQDSIWYGPIHMHDLQTFRLRHNELRQRASALRIKVQQDRKLEATLASASFHLEVAETGMSDLVSLYLPIDELAIQRWVGAVLLKARDILAAIEDGKDYFDGKTGVVVKAYVSKLDGSVQPYILQVPEDLTKGMMPLVVFLHGWGVHRSLVNWGDPKNFQPWKENYIRLQVYGRGWTRYKGVGTDDVFAAIAEVKRDYNIDADRIYLTGRSMGGAGAWFLATHFPDVFAAVAPLCGYTDYRLDYGSTNAKLEWEHRLYLAHDALTSAINLKRMPVYFIHGDQDLPGAYGAGVNVEHSRVMAKRLRELDISFRYDELKGVAHSVPIEHHQKAEKWLLNHRRESNPPEVVFQTSTLRFNRAYWVEIEGLREHYRESRIEARRVANELIIKTAGLTHFAVLQSSFDPDQVKLVCKIDGQSLTAKLGEASKLHFALTNGLWQLRKAAPAGLRKKHGLQGPWIDPFLGPAIYVLPSSHKDYTELAAFDLETLQRAHGGLDCSNVRGRAEVEIPMKKDHEISDVDIWGRNLILFGDPRCNSVLAKIHDRLPIRWTPRALLAGKSEFTGDVGAKFVWPNPLNPEKYVAVVMGTRAKALCSLRIFHWQIPDFLVFGPEALRVGDIPYHGASEQHHKLLDGAYRLAGFFDENWRLPAKYSGATSWSSTQESQALEMST